MPDVNTPQLEAIDETGSGLRLSFYWHGDRYAHRVSLVDGGAEATSLLASVEDVGDDPAWPCSPPLQQLHIEDRAGGAAAMLVGMAGRSHWSMSVESRPAARELHFDLACRLQQRPEMPLSTRYRLEHAALVASEADRIRFTVGAQTALLLFEVAIATDRIRCNVQPGQIGLSIAVPAVPRPTTIRWRYTVKLEPYHIAMRTD